MTLTECKRVSRGKTCKDWNYGEKITEWESYFLFITKDSEGVISTFQNSSFIVSGWFFLTQIWSKTWSSYCSATTVQMRDMSRLQILPYSQSNKLNEQQQLVQPVISGLYFPVFCLSGDIQAALHSLLVEVDGCCSCMQPKKKLETLLRAEKVPL